jgi:hypothetical protein
MRTPEVGKYYKVTMPGEKDFGGRVKVDKVVKSKLPTVVTVHFEIGKWIDDNTLTFDVLTGVRAGIYYNAVAHDIFCSNKVNFKECK